MDWVQWFFYATFGLIGLLIVLWICQGITWILTPYGPEFQVSGRVKVLSYTPSETVTGVGPGTMGGMAVTVGTTSTHWTVVLALDHDRKQWIVEDEDLFTGVEQGDHVLLTVRSKTVWGEDKWDLVKWLKVGNTRETKS